MTNETAELKNVWPVCKRSYRPITSKICSLIASQLLYTENDTCLQDHAELISGCIGTVPERRVEQDWEDLVTAMLLPGQVLAGIGSCIGPNDVTAVKEALSDPDMYVNHISTNNKIIIGVFIGAVMQNKTVKWIEYLVSKTIHRNIECKVIRYDEMQDIITVLIMAKR